MMRMYNVWVKHSAAFTDWKFNIMFSDERPSVGDTYTFDGHTQYVVTQEIRRLPPSTRRRAPVLNCWVLST